MKKTAAKVLLVLAAAVLLVTGTIGGTLAWLTAETETVKNTFTVGNIDITLDEGDDLDLKMIPGSTIEKDPVVTVIGGSEDCWLFVKVEETGLTGYIEYAMAEGWIELETGVYYRTVGASTSDQSFSVLKDDQVTVPANVTKAMMDELEKAGATLPALAFTAYAVQKANVADAATALPPPKSASPPKITSESAIKAKNLTLDARTE